MATGYSTIRYGLSTNAFDVTLLAREYRALGASAPRDFLWVNLILAASGGGSGQLSFDPARLGLKEADRTQPTAAVQTTRAIIMAHV